MRWSLRHWLVWMSGGLISFQRWVFSKRTYLTRLWTSKSTGFLTSMLSSLLQRMLITIKQLLWNFPMCSKFRFTTRQSLYRPLHHFWLSRMSLIKHFLMIWVHPLFPWYQWFKAVKVSVYGSELLKCQQQIWTSPITVFPSFSSNLWVLRQSFHWTPLSKQESSSLLIAAIKELVKR